MKTLSMTQEKLTTIRGTVGCKQEAALQVYAAWAVSRPLQLAPSKVTALNQAIAMLAFILGKIQRTVKMKKVAALSVQST